MKNQKESLLRHKTLVLNAIENNNDNVVLEKYLWLTKYHNRLVSETEPYFSDTRIKPKEIESRLKKNKFT